MKSLHLLLVAMAAAMPTQSREGKDNYIIWFPVEGEEGVFVSTKGEIYIPPSIGRRSRQKRYSHSEPEEIMYYPYEESDSDDNFKYSGQGFNIPSHGMPNFPANKNPYPMPSQPFKNIKAWVKGLGGKSQKLIHSLNQDKEYSAGIMKYVPNPQNVYPGFEPYHEMEYYHQPTQENHNWQEQYYDIKHHQEANFENEKPVTENVNESSYPKPYVSSFVRPNGKQTTSSHVPKKSGSQRNTNWSHNTNHFELPNKAGDFTFPEYDSDGFYSPSAIQQYQTHYDSETVYKPSADHVFSSSTEEFTKHTSNSVHPSWPATPAASDDFVFPGETDRKTKSPFVTSSASNSRLTTSSMECERSCLITSEFNPVCGTDYMTYSNIGKLKCAVKCGRDVHFYHYGSCGRSSLATPLH